jgi:4-diphosphocytidyl-2-C-methyl-D-erythritol kinase
MRLDAFAPAKVNLFLHVGGPDAEGYHPISSLMLFADVGDRVRCRRPTRPASRPLVGSAARCRLDDGNLVVRAANALRAASAGRSRRSA